MRTQKTVTQLQKMKDSGTGISALTAYDATFARLLDEKGEIDLLLVGDSLGMTIQGHDTTLPVTVDDIIYHTRAVVRATKHAHVVADMPFMSFQTTIEKALENAGRMMKESGAQSVKIEGGIADSELVRRMVAIGIPVMGHVGLTPQRVHAMGGFKRQGKTEDQAAEVEAAARAFAEAGAYAVVLECIPDTLARKITRQLAIPTIGIGSGPDCDGQILVCYDMLGLSGDYTPPFVKRYEDLAATVKDAVSAFSHDVRQENRRKEPLPASETCDVELQAGHHPCHRKPEEFADRHAYEC